MFPVFRLKEYKIIAHDCAGLNRFTRILCHPDVNLRQKIETVKNEKSRI
jgi:hypothetical protein